MPIDISAALSVPGPRTPHNEDAALIHLRGSRAILGVFDGVGGAPCGEIAARLAAACVLEELAPDGEILAIEDERVRAACGRIQCRLAEESLARGLPARMGTVATFAVVEVSGEEEDAAAVTESPLMGPRLRGLIAHVGDTRALAIAPDGSGAQLTRDHSAVALDRLPEAGSLHIKGRNLITRYFGMEEYDGDGASALIDIVPVDLVGGHYLVLCSDGVGDFVDHSHLFSLVRPGNPDAAALGERIASTAAAAQLNPSFPKGDNISVVVARATVRRREGEIEGSDGARAAAQSAGGKPTGTGAARRSRWLAPLGVAAALAAVGCQIGTLMLIASLLRDEPSEGPVQLTPSSYPLADQVRAACDERVDAGERCVLRLTAPIPDDPALDPSGHWQDADLRGEPGRRQVLSGREMEIDAGRSVRWVNLQLDGGFPSLIRIGCGAEFQMSGVVWNAPADDMHVELGPGARLALDAGSLIRVRNLQVLAAPPDTVASCVGAEDGSGGPPARPTVDLIEAQLVVEEGSPVLPANAKRALLQLGGSSLLQVGRDSFFSGLSEKRGAPDITGMGGGDGSSRPQVLLSGDWPPARVGALHTSLSEQGIRLARELR